MKSGLWRFYLALLGIVAFLTLAIGLDHYTGVLFAFTFHVACASACLFFIAKIGLDYPGERWPRIALVIALLVNIGLFFSPLRHLPASKGDILLFRAPDAAIMLATRTFSYRVTNDHQRAVRQQMILGLILASALCAALLSLVLIHPHTSH